MPDLSSHHLLSSNKIINMLWIGDTISNIERLCMLSFIANGHQVNLYAYHTIKNMPVEVNLCDANEILPAKQIFKHMGSYAAFADYFRWKLLLEKGGWWVDTDVVCLKPFNFSEENILTWEQPKVLLTPTIMKLKKHSFIAQEMTMCATHPFKLRPYDNAKIRSKKLRKRFYLFNRPKAIDWGVTAGPRGVTNAYFHFKNKLNDITVFNEDIFYPISWHNWQDIITPKVYTIAQLPESCHGLHLWNNFWREHNIDKNGQFAKDSLIGEIITKYYR